MLPNDGNTTEEDDPDIDLNISGDDFDFEFPSGQKIISTQFSRSDIPSQMDVLTPTPIQQKPLAPCSSNRVPPSTQRIPLPSQLPNSTGLKVVPDTNSKRKRGPGKKKKSTSILIDSDSENERSSGRQRPNSNLSIAEALV